MKSLRKFLKNLHKYASISLENLAHLFMHIFVRLMDFIHYFVPLLFGKNVLSHSFHLENIYCPLCARDYTWRIPLTAFLQIESHLTIVAFHPRFSLGTSPTSDLSFLLPPNASTYHTHAHVGRALFHTCVFARLSCPVLEVREQGRWIARKSMNLFLCFKMAVPH